MGSKKGGRMRRKRMNGEKNSEVGTVIIDEDPCFAMVPGELVKVGEVLSHGAFRFWVVLKYYSRLELNEEGEVKYHPSLGNIAEHMGISINQALTYKNELVGISLVKTEKRHRLCDVGVINIYTLVAVGKWWREKGKKLQAELRKEKAIKYKDVRIGRKRDDFIEPGALSDRSQSIL